MLRLACLASVACALAACARRPGPTGAVPEATRGEAVVARVRVEGARRVPAYAIRQKIATRGTPAAELTRALRVKRAYRWLDRRDLDDDVRRIENLYRLEGFLRARVAGVEVREAFAGRRGRGGPRWVDVVFRVEEGPRAALRDVEVRGLEDLPEGEESRARSAVSLREGRAFDYDAYSRSLAALRSFLSERGYAWARVLGQVRADADAGAVDVGIDVDPGEVGLLGEVRLSGRFTVPESLIRKQIRLVPGQVYRPRDLERLQSDLYDLGIFSTVTVAPDLSVPEGSPIPVDVLVREGDPRLLEVGGGVRVESSRFDARASVLLQDRNAFRRAVRLSSRTEAGYSVLPALGDPEYHGPLASEELKATFPHVPWSQFQTSLRGAVVLEIGQGYQYWGPQFEAAVQYAPGRRLLVSLGYNLRSYDFFSVDEELLDLSAGPVDDPTVTGAGTTFMDPYRLGYLELRLRGDGRDDPLSPMSGVAAELTVAGGASFLGGEFTYLRVRGEVSGYLPLVPRTLSLAARIGAGAIRPFDDLGAPYLQRFRLGGAATVRGWGYEQLSPRVPGEDCGADDGCPDTPVGGNAMVLANLELRVYSRVGLGFAGFVDAGRVWESAFGGPADLQVSVGGGVRYRTPIGVVRLDAGVPVVRDPTLAAGQPGFGIHFGIGEAF